MLRGKHAGQVWLVEAGSTHSPAHSGLTAHVPVSAPRATATWEWPPRLHAADRGWRKRMRTSHPMSEGAAHRPALEASPAHRARERRRRRAITVVCLHARTREATGRAAAIVSPVVAVVGSVVGSRFGTGLGPAALVAIAAIQLPGSRTAPAGVGPRVLVLGDGRA